MSSTDDFKEEGAQSGYAEARHHCPHANEHVQPIDLRDQVLDPNHTVCARCPNSRENWLCLHCQQVFCGRFAAGHMLQHYESTGHCVAAGLDDLSFWCYRCESYIFHRTIPPVYNAYAILTMLKFHEAPVDPPLLSACPTDVVGGEEEDDDEEEEKGEAEEESQTDTHMETSRTAAAAAAPPSRSSSQLDPVDTQPDELSQEAEAEAEAEAGRGSQNENDCDSSAQPSRAASSLGAAPALASVACPVAGLTAAQMADPLVQRICGIIFGGCLGDAHGLATEFLDRSQVARLYGPHYDPATGAGSIPFPHTKKTRHSSRWDHGDWTDDSDQMILILESILETYAGDRALATDLHPDPQLFAHKLAAWVEQGFPELGDRGGMGLGALTNAVVSHPQFKSDPHAAAHAVWSKSGKVAAANGGVMRTSITGVFDFHHIGRVHRNTRLLAQVTHADPRCIASCVLVATALSGVLQGAPVGTEAEVEAFLEQCIAITLREVPLGAHEETFLAHARMKRLEEMKLDEPAAIGYTLKCMASGLYGLRSHEPFEVALTRLVREAGDADTNGAVCGAMLGAKIGYDGLPAEWLKALPNKPWLDAKVVQLVQLMMARLEHDKKQKTKQSASAVAGAESAPSEASE